ncbi:hypothetical protein O3Q52_00490 [Streptomyces sp. ActVer]|uniref:hypothetical protein n=1 Tax=Streptomyces sp. ActVer TaxID=3014558 RepID=UPI0022B36C84|nr:hypothetical protein [Streptomyces sp. ActVer]MCZ4506708.1 hypothetical protein [Streptomyces sp. ActVer]
MAMSNPAAADDDNTGVVGGAPSGGTCITNIQGAAACFQPYGDVIWSKDTSTDGYGVYAKWTNQLRDSGGSWSTYRSGKCSNPGSSGDWASCNKDFYEADNTNAYGGQGSRIQVTACIASIGDDECDTSPWISNNG